MSFYGKYPPEGVPASGRDVLLATVTLSAAQVKNLATVPIELIAADPTLTTQLLAVEATLNYGGTPFNMLAGTVMYVQYTDNPGVALVELDRSFVNLSSTSTKSFFNQTGQYIKGSAVSIQVFTTNITAGNSTLTLNLYYQAF